MWKIIAIWTFATSAGDLPLAPQYPGVVAPELSMEMEYEVCQDILSTNREAIWRPSPYIFIRLQHVCVPVPAP